MKCRKQQNSFHKSSLMITYQHTLENITPAGLKGFFAGWKSPPPSEEKFYEILEGSAEIVLAVDDESNRVVGFITAISDGVQNAFIPLLEVLPEYRGRGIGRELVRRMLARLDGYYAIDLTCDPSLQPFYGKSGMMPSTGMCIRNFNWTAGHLPEGE